MTTALATQPEPPDSILTVIERAAGNPSIDVDKFDRLLAMRERVEARQAEHAFVSAMAAVQSELLRVAPDKTNPQTRSEYASEAAIDRALRPIYTAHGFSLSFTTGAARSESDIKIICHCSHSGGHTRTYEVDMPADGKGAKGGDVMTRTHAAGSAMSYGKRYLHRLIFNLAIGHDDDGNGAGGDYITKDQAATISDMLEETASNRDAFLRLFKAESVETILSAQYGKAIAALTAKAKSVREAK